MEDIAYINDYALKNGRPVRSRFLDSKGRILESRKDFCVGDTIFIEPPLHIVSEDENNRSFKKLKRLVSERNLDYETLWYWAALNSLCEPIAADIHLIPKDRQKRLLMLYHEPVSCWERDATLLRECKGRRP